MILVITAIGAAAIAYVIGWRRGYKASDHPHRRAGE